MMITDKEALLCDLAETYHIYDYKSLPLSKVAIFAVGLRENSRIKMKLRGTIYTLEEILLASIADKLAISVWLKTKDAEKGQNRPKSILLQMLGKQEESEYEVFDSSNEFEKRRMEILQKGG